MITTCRVCQICNLTGANLTGANLTGANLTGANFWRWKFINLTIYKKMGQTWPLFVHFRSFHMTNIAQILQMIKVWMVCLGLKPRRQNGRHRQIHRALAAHHFYLYLLKNVPFSVSLTCTLGLLSDFCTTKNLEFIEFRTRIVGTKGEHTVH